MSRKRKSRRTASAAASSKGFHGQPVTASTGGDRTTSISNTAGNQQRMKEKAAAKAHIYQGESPPDKRNSGGVAVTAQANASGGDGAGVDMSGIRDRLQQQQGTAPTQASASASTGEGEQGDPPTPVPTTSASNGGEAVTPSASANSGEATSPQASSAQPDPTPADPSDGGGNDGGNDAIATALNSSQAALNAANTTIASLQAQNAEQAERIAAQEAEQQRTTAALDSVQTALAESTATQQNLIETFNRGTPVDYSGVNFNTHTTTNSEPKGPLKELFNALDSSAAQSRIVASQYHNKTHCYDASPLNLAFDALIEESGGSLARSGHFWNAITEHGKSLGFYDGKNHMVDVINAAGPTTGLTMQDGHLDVLITGLMRESNTVSRLMPQFIHEVYRPNSTIHGEMRVPRIDYLPEATDETDYHGSTIDSHFPLGDTVGTNTDSQGVTVGTVGIRVREYMLGTGTKVETRPLYLPELQYMTSAYDVGQVLSRTILKNWRSAEALFCRNPYFQSTKVVYSDGVDIVDDPLLVTAGGTVTEGALDCLYHYMHGYVDNGQPSPFLPLDDGKYILVLPNFPMKQLKGDMRQYQRRIISTDLLPMVEAMVNTTWGNEMRAELRPYYFGTLGQFHIFLTNSWGTSAAGASPQVNSVQYGNGGPLVSDDALVFGAGVAGRGTLAPMQVRSNDGAYMRGTGFIWTYLGGFAPMDCDSAIAGDHNQQTRCLRWRIPRVAVA